MVWIYLLLLFILTAAGAMLPLLLKEFRQSWMMLMLAFSGSFLLGITLLHLMPETFHELGEKAGLYILGGFFLQLILQHFSHGIEHGHVHDHHASSTLMPIIAGLSVHAFLEGIPLGFNYQSHATLPSIFAGVAAHKLPEAVTLCTLLLSTPVFRYKIPVLVCFALISPLSAMLSMYYGQKFLFVSHLLVYIIPVVIGSFLHISTTVLYESGTRHHELSRQKILAVLSGLGFALITLLLHEH